MNEQKEKKVSRPPQIILVLRLVAGVYLLYLAYGLLQDFLAPGNSRQLLQGIAILVFVVTGAILSVWTGKKLLKGEFLRPGQIPDDEEEK